MKSQTPKQERKKTLCPVCLKNSKSVYEWACDNCYQDKSKNTRIVELALGGVNG